MFLAMLQAVDNQYIVDSLPIKAAHQITADKSGPAGHDDHIRILLAYLSSRENKAELSAGEMIF